jgi:hypothetical protein
LEQASLQDISVQKPAHFRSELDQKSSQFEPTCLVSIACQYQFSVLFALTNQDVYHRYHYAKDG